VTDVMGKKRVLVVDDEPGVRRLVSEILNKEYTVLEGQNGEDAVAMARSLQPDLILMDMMMPRMDGLTACSAIKKDPVTSGIPVLMLTAISHGLNRKLAENTAGANGYMTKPFHSRELLANIGRLLSPSQPGPGEGGAESDLQKPGRYTPVTSKQS
jgi:two-component system response regulator RpaA